MQICDYIKFFAAFYLEKAFDEFEIANVCGRMERRPTGASVGNVDWRAGIDQIFEKCQLQSLHGNMQRGNTSK